MREALEQCKKLYDRMVDSFLMAHDDINSCDYTAGKGKLKEVIPLSQPCEDGFAKGGVHSPFMKRSQDSVKLAIMGITFTNLIK